MGGRHHTTNHHRKIQPLINQYYLKLKIHWQFYLALIQVLVQFEESWLAKLDWLLIITYHRLLLDKEEEGLKDRVLVCWKYLSIECPYRDNHSNKLLHSNSMSLHHLYQASGKQHLLQMSKQFTMLSHSSKENHPSWA